MYVIYLSVDELSFLYIHKTLYIIHLIIFYVYIYKDNVYKSFDHILYSISLKQS